MSHTPSTEEREITDFVSYAEKLGYRNPMYLPQHVKTAISRAYKLHTSTAKASEAALVDKLRPRLVDKDSNLYDASGKPFGHDEEIEAENKLKAELRQALGINLDQEREE